MKQIETMLKFKFRPSSKSESEVDRDAISSRYICATFSKEVPIFGPCHGELATNIYLAKHYSTRWLFTSQKYTHLWPS